LRSASGLALVVTAVELSLAVEASPMASLLDQIAIDFLQKLI
jgi:hypothetical protein